MSIINKPPQHVKREYELEEPVALVVEKYATFIDSTPSIFVCPFPRAISFFRSWLCGRGLHLRS
jgi:hypothetical protein